jgi:hypothetical protein
MEPFLPHLSCLTVYLADRYPPRVARCDPGTCSRWQRRWYRRCDSTPKRDDPPEVLTEHAGNDPGAEATSPTASGNRATRFGVDRAGPGDPGSRRRGHRWAPRPCLLAEHLECLGGRVWDAPEVGGAGRMGRTLRGMVRDRDDRGAVVASRGGSSTKDPLARGDSRQRA